jgi:alanine racemase
MSQNTDTFLSSSVAHISWDAFSSNWKLLQSKLPKGTSLLPMVKTNGYGHDLEIISSYCSKLGAVGMGVANMFEAIELRTLGYEERIVSFGRLNAEILDAASEFQIHIVVHSLEDINLLKQHSSRVVFHLEIETGMNRLGINLEDIEEVHELLLSTPHALEGIFSHFVESEISNKDFTNQQIQRFENFITKFKTKYKKPFVAHMENSGAILNGDKHFEWVRPGISLYGYHPEAGTQKSTLSPVLSWCAPLIQIKHIKKGEFVGYNRTFEAKKNMVIGTLPIGYGDGFARNYKSLHVGYQNEKCPIIGNICMDLMMIDLTHIQKPILNDAVFLLGDGSQNEPTAWDYAKVDRTIPYEVLTRISPRVIRTES